MEVPVILGLNARAQSRDRVARRSLSQTDPEHFFTQNWAIGAHKAECSATPYSEVDA